MARFASRIAGGLGTFASRPFLVLLIRRNCGAI
jgi:hypothetical protein